MSVKTAVALSLAIHLALLLGPRWQLPTEEPPLPVLQGRFRLTPKASASTEPELAPKPVPKPMRPARAKPDVKPSEPTSGFSLPPVAAPEPSASTPPVSAPPPAPAPQEPARDKTTQPQAEAAPGEVPMAAPISPEMLPLRGLMRFEVTRGRQKLQLGQAGHYWVREGDAYILTSITETTGLAAVFKRFKLTQISSGRITDKGLMPGRFVSRRDDDPKPVTQSDFDYQTGKLTQVYEGRTTEYSIQPGSQDLLSLIYQWVLLAPQDQTVIQVATGKSYNPYTLRLYGDEDIETKVGTLHTRHYGSVAPPGERSTEVWLALDYDLLPVRIRFNEKEGEIWEMSVIEAAFGGVLLKPRDDLKLPGQ